VRPKGGGDWRLFKSQILPKWGLIPPDGTLQTTYMEGCPCRVVRRGPREINHTSSYPGFIPSNESVVLSRGSCAPSNGVEADVIIFSQAIEGDHRELVQNIS